MLRIERGKGFLKDVNTKLYERRSMEVGPTILCAEDKNPMGLFRRDKSFKGAIESGYGQIT